MTQLPFDLFLVIWNQYQGLSTPELHLRMGRWLAQLWEAGERRMLLMAFRSAGKSTVIGIFCAWLLYRNPNLRIMIMGAEQVLARKLVRNARAIIEQHPLTRELYGDGEEWGQDRFTVTRKWVSRDPSMIARSVLSNITGSRAELIIFDDVEVPNTCGTPDKRDGLRHRLTEAEFVLAEGGRLLYIGTPHHYHSIYAREAAREYGEERPFLHGYQRLELPITQGGVSNWPERFPMEEVARLKASVGPLKFASQMMLKPVNIIESRLDYASVQSYGAETQYTESAGRPRLMLGDDSIDGVSVWWDPAFGKADSKSDGSVLALIYKSAQGRRYLHDLRYIVLDTASPEDAATQQCLAVTSFCTEYDVPSVTVENNGIGQFLPSILRRILAQKGVKTRVNSVPNRINKDLRILEGFDALLAARRLYIHDRVTQTAFMQEMRDWQPGQMRGHDDGLDAVACALLQPFSPLGHAAHSSAVIDNNFNPLK